MAPADPAEVAAVPRGPAAPSAPAEAGGPNGPLFCVLDTNRVLDAWVFADPSTATLRATLQSRSWQTLVSAPMRAELQRVLAYPHIDAALRRRGLSAEEVLAVVDAHSHPVDPAPKAPVTCRDRDDQKFIDLAVAWRVPLLSRDRDVLRLGKRLASLGVWVAEDAPPAHVDDGRNPVKAGFMGVLAATFPVASRGDSRPHRGGEAWQEVHT